MACARGIESLQLNCETRVDSDAKPFACCKHRLPALFRVAAPLRSFDQRNLSVTKASEVIDGCADAEGVVNGNSCAPYGRTVGANRHRRDPRRLVRGGIDQQ